MTETKFEKS